MFRSLYLSIFLTASSALTPVVRAINTVGFPNLMFRNQKTGDNRVWLMSGTHKDSEQTLQANVNSPEWKIIGAGDFNQDGIQDILWNAPAYGVSAVWLMSGSGFTFSSSVTLPASPSSPNWLAVAVADFNADGKPDILFHNQATSANVLWLMNGTSLLGSPITLYSNPDTNWHAVGAADMDADGSVDLIIRNAVTGMVGIQYMNGYAHSRSILLTPWDDLDFDICAAADYDGDGYKDLIWRHCTTGVNETMNLYWFTDGSGVRQNQIKPTGGFTLLEPIHDTDWRLMSQRPYESTWRINWHQSNAEMMDVYVSPAYNQVLINFQLARECNVLSVNSG